jgi:hypothetical protein
MVVGWWVEVATFRVQSVDLARNVIAHGALLRSAIVDNNVQARFFIDQTLCNGA